MLVINISLFNFKPIVQLHQQLTIPYIDDSLQVSKEERSHLFDWQGQLSFSASYVSAVKNSHGTDTCFPTEKHHRPHRLLSA